MLTLGNNRAFQTPIRTLGIIGRYYPIIGGSEVQAHQLNIRLLKGGFHVQVLTSRIRKDLSKYEDVDGVPVIRTGLPLSSPLWAISYVASTVWWLIRNRKHYDIIHSHGNIGSAIYLSPIAKLLGKPIICKIATAGKIHLYHESLLKRLLLLPLAKPSCFVAMTEEIRGELQDIGIPPTRTVIVPNGVNVEKYRSLPNNEKKLLRKNLGLNLDRPIALFCGRLVHRKGIDIIVESFKPEANENLDMTVVLIGSGDLQADSIEQKVREAVIRWDLSKRILLLGEKSDPLPYYLASDIFIFPSLREGMSNALLEALASGLAIIASDIPSNKEIISHNANGLLFRSGDPVDLAAKLRELILNPELREKLSVGARETALNIYSFENIFDRYRHLYLDLLGEQPCAE